MKRVISTAVTALVLGSGAASAAVSDREFAELKAQFAAMADRLNALEAENAQLRDLSGSTADQLAATRSDLGKVQATAAARGDNWTDNIKLKGDFRYRYEGIDIQGANNRERNRIRARVALIAKLPNNVEVGVGAATGGDDPVSSNQTLGDGGSSKDLRLDLAYFRWQATDELYITGGKYKNVFYQPLKSQLLWDGDYNPEGLAIGWDNDAVFAAFSGNFLESDSGDKNRQFSWGAQGGLRADLGAAKLVVGAGYYDIKTAGKETFYGDFDDFFGNSSVCVDGTCVYQYDYEEVEVFADLSMTVADMPLQIFADYVQNLDADEYDTGWIAGVQLGKAKQEGSWQAAYMYQDLEADAVLGLLSDSDFAGGGTDGKGHVLKGAYAIGPQWTLGVAWFINNKFGESRGLDIDYDRIQLDTQFKF